MKKRALLWAGLALFASARWTTAEVRVVTEQNTGDSTGAPFRFAKVPAPVENDAAAEATVTVVDGKPDGNSGALSVLTDGKLPADEDQPRANFFFAAGTDGGRLLLDLGRETRIARIGTYSWHGDTRGPQVYTLFGLATNSSLEALQLVRPQDPAGHGWTQLAKVDTRSEERGAGGQHGVVIQDPGAGHLGSFRYLLFDVSPAERRDAFGNTFFSEIDVVGVGQDNSLREIAVKNAFEVFRSADGVYEFALDVSGTPELAEWARSTVIPMAQQWYPRLVALLPSKDYQAPKRVRIVFDPQMRGVAATSGSQVRCAADWFRNNLKGEALGAVFHEFVHVVQQYGRRRNRSPVPGWLTEGIADYIRWFKFEPESKGAEITARNLPRAKYDASYRITGNFLNWVSEKHRADLVPSLNAAIREGRYETGIWKELTGKTLEELGADWRAAMEKAVASAEQAQ